MLITLIRRELLDNLMTFRFAAAVFITLLLVVAATAVLIQDYERRLESYNTSIETHRQRLQKAQTYSIGMGRLYVDRPPNPLSLFNFYLMLLSPSPLLGKWRSKEFLADAISHRNPKADLADRAQRFYMLRTSMSCRKQQIRNTWLKNG